MKIADIHKNGHFVKSQIKHSLNNNCTSSSELRVLTKKSETKGRIIIYIIGSILNTAERGFVA